MSRRRGRVRRPPPRLVQVGAVARWLMRPGRLLEVYGFDTFFISDPRSRYYVAQVPPATILKLLRQGRLARVPGWPWLTAAYVLVGPRP